MASEIVELRGHIIDSLLLPKVMDQILNAGANYDIVAVDIGRSSTDVSRARLNVSHVDQAILDNLIDELHVHGANRVDGADATLVAAERDGVLPHGFYSSTNLPTEVRIGGAWLSVTNPEMDCAVVASAAVGNDGRPGGAPSGSARTVPMHRVRAGDAVVCGTSGVRVTAPDRQGTSSLFEFMSSDVSSEKPKAALMARVADRMRAARAEGRKVLAVCGPAVIHTGGGPSVTRLVREGWIDVLFTGNGFAAHDIESNVLGTSLGVSIGEGLASEGGHANHLRVINEVRRHGSIAAAVESGYIAGGVMYECVQRDVPFILAGSLRDDGPLPDVILHTVTAADAMRELLPGVGVALMLASTLHAIATGNLLPSSVETFCVDINQAVVTKLADRGTHQALGIVTDVGLFLSGLVSALCE